MTDVECAQLEINAAIKQLKRALMTRQTDLGRDAQKMLFAAGEAATEPLLRELRQINFSKKPHPLELSLVTGFCLALHDINERESEKFITNALSKRCHPAVRSSLTGILRHKTSDYRQSDYQGIQIFEHAKIDKRRNASDHVKGWLGNIPDHDVEGISRIYLIKKANWQDFHGYYAQTLSVIVLVWKEYFHPYNPLQWFVRFSHERTFYHEVGHHFHRHSESGHVPEQEQEADAYARRLMRNAHPRLVSFASFLRPLVGGKASETESNAINQDADLRDMDLNSAVNSPDTAPEKEAP